MVKAYRANGHSVTALVWTRGRPPAVAADVHACTAPGGYGRKLRGLGARLRWFWFILRHMIALSGRYDIVHTVDLDTAILAVPLARALRKRIVYDAFDHAAAIFNPGFIARMLAAIERRLLRVSDLVIFPDESRLRQYGVAGDPINYTIIANIPELSSPPTAPPATATGPLKIVYVGTLEAVHRGLEYIPYLCAELPSKITFVVAGLGFLTELFERESARLPNLTFVGEIAYPNALNLMRGADCLYGPYLLTTAAHRFAAPNKVYEHLALGRPLITNAGTPPAALVKELESGFVFDGSREGALRLMRQLDREQCRQTGARALHAWHTRFTALRNEQIATFFDRLRPLSPV